MGELSAAFGGDRAAQKYFPDQVGGPRGFGEKHRLRPQNAGGFSPARWCQALALANIKVK
jgi:hypothetical protein